MNPPEMISCLDEALGTMDLSTYTPDCPACVEINKERVEEYRLYLKREARDHRIGCIGVVIAAVLFWSLIGAIFYIGLS